jgi:hypothetical protein
VLTDGAPGGLPGALAFLKPASSTVTNSRSIPLDLANGASSRTAGWPYSLDHWCPSREKGEFRIRAKIPATSLRFEVDNRTGSVVTDETNQQSHHDAPHAGTLRETTAEPVSAGRAVSRWQISDSPRVATRRLLHMWVTLPARIIFLGT